MPGWAWVIVGLVVAFVVVGVANSIVEDRVGQTAVPSPTPTAIPRIVVTPATATDMVVWRFCVDVVAGTTEDWQVGAVYDLDTSALSKDRDWALQVVGLVRREIDAPGFNAEAVAELHDLCREWQRADWKQR